VIKILLFRFQFRDLNPVGIAQLEHLGLEIEVLVKGKSIS
jgi:hypothetical protein